MPEIFASIDTGEASIFVRTAGSGPPLLLLHGFPQTQLMWRDVAPILARNFTVVCAAPACADAGETPGVGAGGHHR